jgi:hypothetical protein
MFISIFQREAKPKLGDNTGAHNLASLSEPGKIDHFTNCDGNKQKK